MKKMDAARGVKVSLPSSKEKCSMAHSNGQQHRTPRAACSSALRGGAELRNRTALFVTRCLPIATGSSRIALLAIVCLKFVALNLAGFCGWSDAIAQVADSGTRTRTESRFEYSQRSMGTEIKLIVYAQDKEHATLAIDAALRNLEENSEPINNYSPRSEVSKLANLKVGEVREIGPVLGQVLLRAYEWGRDSDGAFDVTCGPLFDAWNKARRAKRLPSQEEIDAAMRRAGWENVEPKFEAGQVKSLSFRQSDMSIHVTALATGFLLDGMMEVLKREGIRSALIDAGGDIIVSAAPPDQDGWAVDIAGLDKNEPAIARLQLSHTSVTTSGDLNQFVEIDGTRYSHLVDPRTGRPIRGRVSATVVAKRATDADAGATAIAVLGWERARQGFEQLPIDEVHFLTVDETSRQTIYKSWVRPTR